MSGTEIPAVKVLPNFYKHVNYKEQLPRFLKSGSPVIFTKSFFNKWFTQGLEKIRYFLLNISSKMYRKNLMIIAAGKPWHPVGINEIIALNEPSNRTK